MERTSQLIPVVKTSDKKEVHGDTSTVLMRRVRARSVQYDPIQSHHFFNVHTRTNLMNVPLLSSRHEPVFSLLGVARS